ncbi:host specificity factor TipJ family phage tail protein [Burkholderia vietnamiensis]|uniref:host specificity factor TipJ family phage tail protein n=1 Tax=Burkholderia vietnamiensis TaxID=60552 RepID=UPI001B9BEA36|nr:host specificity factor TipJ family phage tail protein [Burkholderia vietnamiensis]MBR8084569.1 phage tail protein [Burkholderia vietnamiensis]MCA8198355.1 phage tail protein [Burkholderia vietnamiensis]
MFEATLVHCRDPFRPQIGRDVVPIRRSVRLDTLLRKRGMIAQRGRAVRRLHTFMPLINGKPVLERDWSRPVCDGDVVVIAVLPKGGGGGSNPLIVLLQIVVIAVAIITQQYYAAGFAAALGVSTTTASAIIMVGVTMAGTFLVNALVPPTSAPTSMANSQASPTYTIGAQGNSARIQNPIPVLYGRYRTYPDYASQPYIENHGNEQYLYQLFCISQGEISVEKVMIGDTDISSYAEAQYEIIPPGGAMTLFPDNVVTSVDVTGIELKGQNESGDWVGPFVANPAATQTNYIGIDVTLPSGLFHADDNGNPGGATITYQVEYQPIDDYGNPTDPGWFELANELISMATIQPQMISKRYLIAPGRYQVRVRRTSDKSLDSRTANTIQWSGMRAYLPSQHYYGDVTLLAMVIRATNNLNSQTAKKINVVSTRKLPIWNGSSWSAPQPTRNPAWAFADVIRNTSYGRGLPDNRINLDSLLSLAATWDSRGDTFDGIFDTAATLWDVLTQIANVGNAMPVYYAGVIDLVRDEKRAIRTAMFTPANIVQNSLQIEYAFQSYDTPDYVIVQYTDDVTFQSAEVPCVLTGGTQLKPARLQLFGCTSRAQAWRWGIRQAAANRDRRRSITLVTEMEGYIPRYGDLVAVSHDVPAWGLAGSVVAYVGGVVTTSEPLEWTAGQTHYMAFRKRDGSADGPYVVTQGTDEFTAVVAGAPALYISDGDSEEPTYYQFGPGERRGLDCQVLSVTPKGDGQVELSLVNYASSVQDAEASGAVPPPPPASLLPGITDAPVVASVSVIGSPQNGLSVISCTPARGATTYEFQASGDGGSTWFPIGSSVAPSISANLAPGTWSVRARAIGALAGPWAVWSGAIADVTYPPGAPTLTLQNPPFNGGTMHVNISNAKGDFRHVQLILFGIVRYEYDTTNYVIDWDINAARANNAIGPTITVSVTEHNVVGPSTAATITVTKTPPPAPTGTYDATAGTVTINAVSALDLDLYLIREGSSTGTIVYQGTSPGAVTATAGTTYYLSVTDQWGNTSASAAVPAAPPGP